MKRKMCVLCLTMLFAFVSANAQKVISGVITDTETMEPIIGVSVVVKGTTIGTITDFDGNYSLELPEDAETVVFSFVGFETQEIVIGDQSIINVEMSQGSELLNEVVVTGYGTVKESDLTSSISKISADDISAIPVASIDNLLQGKAPGVQVTSVNGRPGGAAYVRIRGLGTLNGDAEPLYVVDGIQIPQRDYQAINTNDIESISVLKDAAATSIYGTRGSNGVIVVTTKRGKFDSKPTVTYNMQAGFKEKTTHKNDFELMNIDQKLQYEIDLGIREDNPEEIERLKGLETDWEDEILRRGIFQSHNGSIRGGTEKVAYFWSANKYHEDGIFESSEFDRISTRINVDYNATDWLNVGNTFSIARTLDGELRETYNVQNAYVGIYSYNPYEPVLQLDPEGNPVLGADGEPLYNFTHQGFNIIEALRKNTENKKYISTLGQFYAELTPVEGLSIKSTINGRYRRYIRESYILPGSILDGYINGFGTPTGNKQDNGSDVFQYTWTNIAQFGKTINEKHSFNVLIGNEFSKTSGSSHSISSQGFPSVDLSTADNAASVTFGSTTISESSISSIFSEAKYNFARRYFITALWRRDGSSRFGANNRFANFGAGSVAWNIASEPFTSGLSNLDQLKVRFSIGTSGNDRPLDGVGTTQNYLPISTVVYSPYGGNQSAGFLSRIPNPDLEWEKNLNYSIGIDYGILNNRISGTVEYFNKKTFDLFFPIQLSRTTGFSQKTGNVGDMLNRGVESEMTVSLIRSKKFDWDIYGNFTYTKSKVTALNDTSDIPGGFYTKLRIGEEPFEFFLNRYAGVDPSNGEALYLDIDGNITNVFRPSDAVFLDGKTPFPKWYGTFGTSFSFFGVNIGVDFYYSGGNYIMNIVKRDLYSDGAFAQSIQAEGALDYWKEPGDITSNPNPFAVQFQTNDSDRWLQKGDYMRLKNLRVGYDFPTKWISKAKMSNLEIFMSASNLWTITAFEGDPEIGIDLEESGAAVNGLTGETALYSYPQTRAITFGANISF